MRETITLCPWPRPGGWCSTCKSWDPVLIAEFVERTRREQGLPAKVSDPLTLRNVATLLGKG